MAALNYKHLRYFWMVAKTGSIARAAEQLHLTPQSISGQLSEFADTLGVVLFRRVGRTLELSEAGRRMLSYADEIFALGDEMLDVVQDTGAVISLTLRVGVADSVSKSVAYRLLEPALKLKEPVRLVCREGRLSALLADLAVHRLDAIIADQPLPATLNVRGYSHLLGESPLDVFAAPELLDRLGENAAAGGRTDTKGTKGTKGSAGFPAFLDGAPFLLPGEDFAIRARLQQWLEGCGLRPHIVGEFDDSALMKAFGQAGAGLFVAPTAISGHVTSQYGVRVVGRIPEVVERLFVISAERRLSHPAVVAISRAAREGVFGSMSA